MTTDDDRGAGSTDGGGPRTTAAGGPDLAAVVADVGRVLQDATEIAVGLGVLAVNRVNALRRSATGQRGDRPLC